jgi:hypothetical protein
MDEMSIKAKAMPHVLLPDRDAMVASVKRLAVRIGKMPSRREFLRTTKLTTRAIERTFGTYYSLMQASGFEVSRGAPRRLPDAVLLKRLRDAVKATNGIPGPEKFARVSRHDPRTVAKRWGGWDRALAALRDWLERAEPGFLHLPALRQHCLGIKLPVPQPLVPRCGELVRFRALDHAPTSENAVIFLFALVAEDLGFVLETLGAGFPDAVGRRRVDDGWRHVRIEFEHQSRNFRIHGHDPRGCDLVVCWEDNWPECPVEVLELKRVIATLGKVPVSGALTSRADAAPHTGRHLTKTPGCLTEKVTGPPRQRA